MKQKKLLFILCGGRIAAIDKKDGTIAWEVKLSAYIKGTIAHGIGQIYVEGDQLFIGVKGILLCLSTKDGSLLWKNELKGWGYGFVSMANVNNEAAAGAMAAQAGAAAAGTAAIATT